MKRLTLILFVALCLQLHAERCLYDHQCHTGQECKQFPGYGGQCVQASGPVPFPTNQDSFGDSCYSSLNCSWGQQCIRGHCQ